MRGRYKFQHQSGSTLLQACDLFRQAIELDPGFAPAYCGLSDALAILYGWIGRDESYLREAERAGARALELAPQLAETHTSTAWVHSLLGRYDEATAGFEEALRRDPTLYEALYLFGRSRFAEGRIADGAELLERAHAARPDEYQAISLQMMMLKSLGRTEEAREAARTTAQVAGRSLELNPGDVRAVYMRGQALLELGAVEEAREAARQALAMVSDDSGVLYNVACLYALMGDRSEALTALERALEVGTLQRDWLERDPDLDALRDEPRFVALLKRL